MGRLPERSTSFIVRLWLESDEDGRCEWRGWVVHAQSGYRASFRDLSAVGDVIERSIAVCGWDAPGT